MKPLVAAATLAVAAVLVSSCASGEPAPEKAPAEVAVLESTFFDPVRPGPAMDLKAPPANLRAAYAEATAVIEADVTGVRVGRELGGMSSVIVTLEPARVLRGALRPEIPVEVEFGPIFEPAAVGRIADEMAAAEVGRGVWLVRWQGEPPPARKPGTPKIDTTADVRLYRTVHLQCGVFVQDTGHVDAATARDDGERTGARVEGERFATLAELADHVVMA